MKNKIIYRLMTEDVQEVARDVLQRDLTTLEMKSIVDQLTESISWFDIISDVLSDVIGENFDKNEKENI